MVQLIFLQKTTCYIPDHTTMFLEQKNSHDPTHHPTPGRQKKPTARRKSLVTRMTRSTTEVSLSMLNLGGATAWVLTHLQYV